MIETTLRGRFNHNETKHDQDGGQCGGERVPKRSKIGPTMANATNA